MELETPDVTANQKSAHGVALAAVGVAGAWAAVDASSPVVPVAALAVAALIEVAVVAADAVIRGNRVKSLS